MNYVYGPIPSRRLGQSLGVDPIPLKTCNWNCVYCQLGRTSLLVNERRAWAPAAAIVAEVRLAVESHPPGTIDHVSFVGSGEPTLHSDLGRMVREVKAFTPIPVAVITNGSLIGDAGVRADLVAADVVMPTLCAGDEALFRRIHRPHPDLTLAGMVEGLVRFRQEFAGRLWVEVMLMQGVNDTVEALDALAAVLARVQPDQVHLTLPDRPATEPWVEPPDADGLMRATALLGKALGEAARVVPPSGTLFDLSGHADAVEALLAIITRHPMSDAQLEQTLAHEPAAETARVRAALAESGRARHIVRHGVGFWAAVEQHFVGLNGASPSSVEHQGLGDEADLPLNTRSSTFEP